MKMQIQMIQFVSSVNLIQIWLMKVISSHENIVIQQFRYSLKSKLIEVMNIKMQIIQFVSTVNLTQMWLMQVIYNMKNNLVQEFQHPWVSRMIAN
jgi:hypothetical protein